MKLIIDHSSMIPIYEQIVTQIKCDIKNNQLKVNDSLPSVRTLANECKISALTVKKAYDTLEQEGLIATVHGKGSYVTASNQAVLQEESQKELENELLLSIKKAKLAGIDKESVRASFGLIMEEIYD